MMLDQCIPEGDLALMKWLLGHIRHIIRPSLPGWLAFTCVSAVPKKKLNRRGERGEMERGEREAGSTHIARCLSGLLSDSAAVALEKASRACSRTALRRACSIDRALGDRTRDASCTN